MEFATVAFAWSTALFFILWVYALAGRRKLAERHLMAIRFSLSCQSTNWPSARRFLRCYLDGRHDIIEQDFPTFLEMCGDQDVNQ